MELLSSIHVSSAICGLEILEDLRLSCCECMEVHIDAICWLSNVMLALRRELPHSFLRHAQPPCQQLQAEALEEPVSVGVRTSPRKHHPLADQSLASV
jgi:hypothetical protein